MLVIFVLILSREHAFSELFVKIQKTVKIVAILQNKVTTLTIEGVGNRLVPVSASCEHFFILKSANSILLSKSSATFWTIFRAIQRFSLSTKVQLHRSLNTGTSTSKLRSFFVSILTIGIWTADVQ
jgi:hypothetical protein